MVVAVVSVLIGFWAVRPPRQGLPVGRGRPRLGLLAVLLLWASLGALRHLTWIHHPAHHVVHTVPSDRQPVVVHGVVVEDPVELFNPPEPERVVCVIEARHIQTHDGWKPVTGRIRARLLNPRFALAHGDEVLVEGQWSRVPGPGNPGQFDWRSALAREGIHALLSVGSHHGMVRLRRGQGRWWEAGIIALRHRLETRLRATFSDYHAGLLRSFLLGQRVALDEDLKQCFVETGTMHLVVISGFNVGLIAGILELLLRLLGFPLRLRLITSAAALLGYCLLTGMQPPVTRATLMAWVVLGGIWMDRVVNWPNALAAAALMMLWLSPSQLWDPGFQLSFGAVASLLAFTTRFREALEPLLPIPVGWLKRYVAISLAATLAIWVGLWPLLAWYFHLVSPISVIANLILVPLVSVLVSVGTLVLMLGAVAAPLMQWAGGGLTWLVDLTVACVQWLHRIPFGSWPVGRPSSWLIGGYAALVLLSLARRRLKLHAGQVLAAWLIGLNAWLWRAVIGGARASPWLEVTFLDVGHGDSIVVRTPDRHTLLIDAGTPEAGRTVVAPFLRSRGIHTLDAVIVTHPDTDHVGGVGPVLQQVRVRQLLTNGFPPSYRTVHQLMAQLEHRRIPHARLAAGMRLGGVAGVELAVLHPPMGFVPGTDPWSNDNSLVLKLTKDHASVLLCGDLEERGVPWLLASQQALGATILKVPHHGSALGPLGPAFFQAVHPRAAVISVGRLHHLPAAAVLNELNAVHARTFLTLRDGAVVVRTDGNSIQVRTYRNEPRPTPPAVPAGQTAS